MSDRRGSLIRALLACVVLGGLPGTGLASDRPWEQLAPEIERLAVEQRFAELAAVADEAMRAAEQTLGPNDPTVAHLMMTLGAAYRALAIQAMAAYGRTEPFWQRAIQFFEQTEGPEHPDVALALNSLGELYNAQARFQEAKPVFERALAVWEHAGGPHDPLVALVLKNLAWIDKAQGRYDEARARYQRARAIMEDGFLLDDPLYWLILNNFASLQTLDAAQAAATEDVPAEEEDLSEEETARRLKLSALEEIVGPDHPNVADVMKDLAGILALRGRPEEAEALYRRALAIDEQGTDEDAQKKVVATLHRLIDLKTAQHREGDALPLYERLLLLMEHRAGPKHEALIPVLERYAQCLEAAGRPKDAEAARARAHRIRQQLDR